VSETDFSAIKQRATSNPNGPEALRLKWLAERVIGSPRDRLLDLIRESRERRLRVTEIDDYIAEQLSIARKRLESARKDGVIASKRLRAVELAIESAEAAEHGRPERAFNPFLERALMMANAVADEAARLGHM